MIRFITAYRSELYPFPLNRHYPNELPKNIRLIYYFPESKLTEHELIEFAKDLVENEHNIFKDFGQILVYSNSSVLYTAFRALIKEKILRKEDFIAMFYATNDDLKMYKITLDDDGRHEWIPRNFMDSYSTCLRRLL